MSLLLLFNNQVAADAAQVVPTVQVLLETTPDVMVDVSSDYEMFTTTRGRNRELDRFQAGTAMVQLLDTTRKYDPSNTAGPYYPNLKPMRQLQLTGTWNGTTYPLFTGFVDSFESQYAGPPNGNAVTTIYATDGFKVLEAADLASSAYAVEVLNTSPSRWWRLDEPAGSTTFSDSVGTNGTFTSQFGSVPTAGADGLVSRDADTAITLTDSALQHMLAPLGTAPTGTTYSIELLIKVPGGIPAATRNILAWQSAAGDFRRVGIGSVAGNITGPGDGTALNICDGATHHIVFVINNGLGYLYIDGVDKTITPTSETTDYSGGRFYIGGGTTSANMFGGTLDEVAVYQTALSAAQVAAHYAAVATPWNGDTPGARIGRVLDAAAWPAPLRQLDTGTSTLQSAELDMTALEHSQKSAESDFGVLFMKADGRVRFIGRAGLFNLAELATFGDGGGGELGYVSLRPELTDQLIRNDVTVSRLEGVAQNVKDTTSIATYLRHSYVADGLYHNSDTLSKSAAEFIVSEYKEPLRRISNLVVAPRGDPSNLFPKVLGLELEDQITVKDRPPGGGAANSQDTSIEGISHTVTPLWWETTWNLAPSFGASGTPGNVWALGIAGFGELGQTTRLSF